MIKYTKGDDYNEKIIKALTSNRNELYIISNDGITGKLNAM